MTTDKMNIPKTIKIGFQEREDTYTKKLGYVVYVDEKGVTRKAASWNSWRDSKIEPQDFDNVPTSGFVLNKKVGGYSGGWNPRMAWIRVFDPRGFEFEITVQNLLYILEECSSIKGKGLEGEFVYAWDKADLVLLPVSSQEYQSCCEFTKLKTMKLKRKDMVPGCIYMSKNLEQHLYLGQEEFFENNDNMGKKHIFCNLSSNKKDNYNTYYRQYNYYRALPGFTSLAYKVSDEISPLFAYEYDEFKKSEHGNMCKELKFNKMKLTTDELKYHYYRRFIGYTKVDDKFVALFTERNNSYCGWRDMSKEKETYNVFSVKIESTTPFQLALHDKTLLEKDITIEDFHKKYELFEAVLVNDYGKIYKTPTSWYY